jgi:hypothetical protein
MMSKSMDKDVMRTGEWPDAGEAGRPSAPSHAVAMSTVSAMSVRQCGLGPALKGQHGKGGHAGGKKLAVHGHLLCLCCRFSRRAQPESNLHGPLE